MLLATILDSFCVVNNNEICSVNMTFGRAMAVWTMVTQDGPQYVIHLLFIFVFYTEVSHSELTVIMSLVVSTIATAISTFNIIMCTPNEFDPVVLQLELMSRKEDERHLKEKEYKLGQLMVDNSYKNRQKSKSLKSSLKVKEFSMI